MKRAAILSTLLTALALSAASGVVPEAADIAAGDDGSCMDDDEVVPNGEFYCNANVLYQCLDGQGEQLENCNRCHYIGAGTGSEYDTSCKSSETTPETWPSDERYDGPGCYYGYSQICS